MVDDGFEEKEKERKEMKLKPKRKLAYCSGLFLLLFPENKCSCNSGCKCP
jgi:hypothetical protein